MDDIMAYIQAQPVRRYTKNDMVLYQGEMSRSIYYVRSGFVKMYDLSYDGSEQLVGLVGAHDFAPSELLFTRDTAAQFFYAAFTTTEVHVINRDELAARIRVNTDALYQIVQTINDKYHSLRRHLNAVQKPKAREKIVHVLYFLAAYFVTGEQQSLQRVAIPLTQQDIANLVGLSRETTAHELKQLKNEGYISYDKSAFFIRDTLDSLIG